MLALKLLWRNWRSGEVKILAAAIMLAVALVSSINLFTERLESALTSQSNSFLGADRVVRSTIPFSAELFTLAEQAGLRQAQTVQFNSMVFAGEKMHLASIKAVSERYPLLGDLETSTQAFTDQAIITKNIGIPPQGEAWVDARVLPLLGIEIGQYVGVGEKELTVSRIIVREPDRGNGFSLFGARVMINLADLESTQVVQPGSRIQYNWLLAGAESILEPFIETLSTHLNEHQNIRDLQSSQRGIYRSLTTGRQFLSLAGIMGVLLAGVAIAIAAQRFSRRHTNQVALMKSLGASVWQIRRLYWRQLLVLALLASLAGLVAGEIIQHIIAQMIAVIYPLQLAAPGLKPYFMSLLTGLACLLFFALPPLWYLPAISPLKVLRSELTTTAFSKAWQAVLGIIAVFLLAWAYSEEVKITSIVLLGFFALAALVAVLAWGLLSAGRSVGMQAGNSWRLARSSIQRHQGQSVMQILVFATVLMLLLVIEVMRTSLIDEWRLKLPADAPNHFMANIAPNEVSAIESLLLKQNLTSNHLFPIVRARLTHVNEVPAIEQIQGNTRITEREANLSWSEVLPNENQLVTGQWWDTWQPPNALPGVSVEHELAQRLQLALGDTLVFSVGGLELKAIVASTRKLDWDTMQPNFFFLLSPRALENFAPMYLTSVYIPASQKLVLKNLLKDFPTILVVELDLIIEQIQKLTSQVSAAIELVLSLVLVAGIMVLLAAVNASMDYRMLEAGILRALGSPKTLILGSTGLEFLTLGAISGLLAVIGAEILLLGLQHWILQTTIQPHYRMWLLGPMVGALLVASLGVWSTREAVTVPPSIVLRDNND